MELKIQMLNKTNKELDMIKFRQDDSIFRSDKLISPKVRVNTRYTMTGARLATENTGLSPKETDLMALSLTNFPKSQVTTPKYERSLNNLNNNGWLSTVSYKNSMVNHPMTPP